jgi:hypothetical protein
MPWQETRTYEYEDKIQYFFAMFSNDSVFIGGKKYPLGQITTEYLNLDTKTIDLLALHGAMFDGYAEEVLLKGSEADQNNPAVLADVQDKLNWILDWFLKLPLYRDLNMDHDRLRNLFLLTRKERPEMWKRMMTPGTSERKYFSALTSQFSINAVQLLTFRHYVTPMLDIFFERLKKRNAEAYAVGLYKYFGDLDTLNTLASALPDEKIYQFSQMCDATQQYVPMPDPTDKMRYILAERMAFIRLGDFLQTDFFRALQHGNAPRRCHNCGRFFLLTAGYNTCYCNNIAPGETERTCRKVGAHKKAEAKERTPAQKEYARVYNRLKTQKSRGKISVDEWNAAVAQAQEVKARTERGELGDEEMKAAFKGMGRG